MSYIFWGRGRPPLPIYYRRKEYVVCVNGVDAVGINSLHLCTGRCYSIGKTVDSCLLSTALVKTEILNE